MLYEVITHGDNLLQMNSTETFFSDSAARVGCANVSCHLIDSTHDYAKSTQFTTANTRSSFLSRSPL